MEPAPRWTTKSAPATRRASRQGASARYERLGIGLVGRRGRCQAGSSMDADDRLLRSGAFVECVFHWVECRRGGTSLIRPSAIRDKICLDCGGDVVVTVFE